MTKSPVRIPVERVEKAILLIRGEKVILDADLAALYGVTTTRLNEQIKRNRDRFPEDFAFRLTEEEFANLMSQFAISSSKHGGRRKLPFVRLRQMLVSNAELARKLEELEKKYHRQFKVVFDAIRKPMTPLSLSASK
jgi:hypothetical protein